MIPGDRGASYTSMVALGLSKNYVLLCHTGNLIFIEMKHKKLFPEISESPLWPIYHSHLYFNLSFLC
jgi:hypothetical protein